MSDTTVVQKIIGEKTVSIPNLSTSGTAVFGGPEFSAATGYTQVSGPLSMVIDVTNLGFISVGYISVNIQTIEGTFNLGDRKHIGFVPLVSHLTITASSVPQLGSIRGTIIKITVKIEVLPSNGGTAIFTVGLRFDRELIPYAPPPIIGSDTRVYNPGVFTGINAGVTVAPGGSNVLIVSSANIVITGPQPLRYRLRAISTKIFPSAFNTATAITVNFTTTFGDIYGIYSEYSDPNRIVSSLYTEPIEFDTNAVIEIRGYNASAVGLFVVGIIFVELIY